MDHDALDDASPLSAAGTTPLATDALFAQVYDRLKAMAGRRLGKGARGTLDTTALVHDLYLRVGANRDLVFAYPEQFFAYAARAMRHLLADRARDRLRQRAGGDWLRTTLTGSDYRFAIDSAEQALALDEALHQLEQTDARAARVVELTCFAGLGQDQIATALGIARRTIARDWRFGRAFLKNALE
ncbi:MAG: ECF-type sigma factor [Tahibacter sp.]